MTDDLLLPQPSGPCARCGHRPATQIMAESTFAYAHGAYEMLCRVCVLTAQLELARDRAAAIPQLEADLAEELRKGLE